jgi:hypothetical protein
MERHKLHPVANPENRNPEVEESGIEAGRVVPINAVRPAGEDDAFRVAPLYFFDGGVVWDEFGIDAGFPHSAGDELRVLSAEVEDEDHGRSVPGFAAFGSAPVFGFRFLVFGFSLPTNNQ